MIDYVAGEDIHSAPHSPCFEESDFGSGLHTFSVEATCNSNTTDDAVLTSFANPPVRLRGVDHTRFEWSAGDTIVFTLHAEDEDLEIEVDFSAVDSNYIPAAEVVTDLGGGDYEVQYTLSSANTVRAGEYRLPVSISPDGTLVRTYRDAVTIRYAPERTGAVTFQDHAGGSFHITDLPTGTDTTIQPIANSFTVTAVPGSQALVTGRIASATSLEGRFVIVNIREANTGGHASLDVEITDSECVTGSGCTSEIELPLVLRPARIDEFEDDDALELELSLGLYTPNGPVFTPSLGISELWLVDKQPTNTLSMRGTLTYERVRVTAEPQDELLPPQNGNPMRFSEEAPLRRVTIEIENFCFDTMRAVTHEDGSWQMYVPNGDACFLNYGPYTMRAVAATEFGVYRVAVKRLDDLASPPYTLDEFVPQKYYPTLHAIPWPYDDHDWGELYVDRDDPLDANDPYDPFYPWFASMQVAIRAQEFAKPFLVGDANTGAFPWANLLIVSGGACGKTSCYSHPWQSILVYENGNNHDSQDEHALAHEMFHWFQGMFMAAIHTNGDCGTVPWSAALAEGFAHTMSTFITEQPWLFHKTFDHAIEAEDPDFQGLSKYASTFGDFIGGLPYDLYATTNDCATGGWSWRILWDFLDGTEAEPWGEFADFPDASKAFGPNTTTIDYGTNFDKVGGLYKFQDVIVRYLGGNYMPENPSRPNLDDRGQDGIDMTEFLDGMLCRGHASWNDMDDIVLDMMHFNAYDWANAPLVCP